MIFKYCVACGKRMIANNYYRKFVCPICGTEEPFDNIYHEADFGRFY